MRYYKQKECLSYVKIQNERVEVNPKAIIKHSVRIQDISSSALIIVSRKCLTIRH